jgi:hypothetical protein
MVAGAIDKMRVSAPRAPRVSGRECTPCRPGSSKTRSCHARCRPRCTTNARPTPSYRHARHIRHAGRRRRRLREQHRRQQGSDERSQPHARGLLQPGGSWVLVERMPSPAGGGWVSSSCAPHTSHATHHAARHKSETAGAAGRRPHNIRCACKTTSCKHTGQHPVCLQAHRTTSGQGNCLDLLMLHRPPHAPHTQ